MQLFFKKFGESPQTILILHGLLGSSDNWQSIARSLSSQYSVYVIDAINHGRSPHQDTMDYSLMANQVLEFMEQQKINSTILLGHSMGGKTAMLTALLYPQKIEKLIVVDIAPSYYEGGHESILFAMAEAPLYATNDRNVIDQFLEYRIPEYGVRQFVLKNLTRNDEGNLVWKSNLEVILKSYRNLMGFPEMDKQFLGETHFIKGKKSSYINDESLPICLRYFPHAQFHTIAQAGHWVHADQPAAFMEMLNKILLIREFG